LISNIDFDIALIPVTDNHENMRPSQTHKEFKQLSAMNMEDYRVFALCKDLENATIVMMGATSGLSLGTYLGLI